MMAVLPSVKARARAQGAEPLDVLYIGSDDSIEQRLAMRATIPFEGLNVGGFRGTGLLNQAANLFRMVRAFGVARRSIKRFRPDVILATGGYVSAAVVLSAAFERVPIMIYLPDLEPGWAIKYLSRWATRIAVSFDEVVKYFDRRKTVVTGYPVRSEFFNQNEAQARAHFQLNSQESVVTVFGGSRGAQSLNRAIEKNLSALLARTQLIHITGDNPDFARMQAQKDNLDESVRGRYFITRYLDEEMPFALGAASLVIARAGAATLGEFPAARVPSVLVPYPYAGQHQDKNAEFLAARGAAIKVEDARLETDLVPAVIGLLDDSRRMSEMSAHAGALFRPDAADKISDTLFEIARQRTSSDRRVTEP